LEDEIIPKELQKYISRGGGTHRGVWTDQALYLRLQSLECRARDRFRSLKKLSNYGDCPDIPKTPVPSSR